MVTGHRGYRPPGPGNSWGPLFGFPGVGFTDPHMGETPPEKRMLNQVVITPSISTPQKLADAFWLFAAGIALALAWRARKLPADPM